ncbi:MAG: MerR family transcriptional regulator [Bacteroidetes bacterium]|nr:MerR family transcriptional regulator [Bacteroidota bacterium]
MGDIFIFRGIDFELGYSDYSTSNGQINISTLLNEKLYKPKSGDFSYRIINHWESNKLLCSTRNNGNGWRKYSVMDLVWLYIIRNMRTFGISLELIKKVKKNLIDSKNTEESVFPLLEYYVSICLVNKPAYLLVFSNGQAHPVTEKEYGSNREFSSKNNHLQINLNNILQKIFPDRSLKAKYKENTEYSPEERKAIQIIRLEAVNRIHLMFSNGKEQFLGMKEKDQFESIVPVINQKQYGQIELVLADESNLVLENEVVQVDSYS